MYQDHFGLQSDPFALGPNLRFLYRSRAHAETMAHLSYGLEQGEDLILIVGVIGTGKTLALQHLQAKVSRLFRQVLVNVTSVDFSGFLKLVLHELGQPWPREADRADLLCLLKDRALQLHADGQKILLVVDEAQNLDAVTIEGIRLLANLGQPGRQLFQIILAGQPSLEELIERPELAQLRQRIRIHYRLEPLTARETGEYIAHRMAVAGRRDEVFTEAAVTRIHELSGGIPRLVNHLAGNALLSAFVAEARRVEQRHVAAEGMPEPPSPDVPSAGPGRPSRQERPPRVADRPDPHEEAPAAAPAVPPPPPPPAAPPPAEPPAEPAPVRRDDRRPTTRRERPAVAGRPRAWLWVWLPLIALILAGVYYVLREEGPRQPPVVQAEDLMPRPGPQDPEPAPAVPQADRPDAGPAPMSGGTAATGRPASGVAGARTPDAPAGRTPGVPAATEASEQAAGRAEAQTGAAPTGSRPEDAGAASPRTGAGRPPAPAVLTDGLWLHVASFRDEDRADRYREQLVAAGSAVVVREVTLDRGEPWLRIMVGPFVGRASADSAAAALERRGLITFHRVMAY